MALSDSRYTITKVLSANDTGDTGGHQSGILVPRNPEILGFFPTLDTTEKNPRCLLPFYDEEHTRWVFAFIYYNNRFFGGTRNEYRLTRMTSYIRQANLKPGDELIFEMKEGKRLVRYKRNQSCGMVADGVLESGSDWKIIQISKETSMSEEIEVSPNPERLIEGLRDTGYEFNSAIADIIDNSIAADATVIDVRLEMDFRGNVEVSIADNGYGMNREDLINAMRYGSPTRPNPASLGKFGLGLKTASTAFCRKISVVSRKKGGPPMQATWDLDHVSQVGNWQLFLSNEPGEDATEHLETVSPGNPGTVVAWAKVDRLMKDYKKPSGDPAKKALNKIVEDLQEHVSMVYQRFLDPKDNRTRNLEIRIGGRRIEAWDPFCVGVSEKVGDETRFVETASGEEIGFSVKAFILPTIYDFPDEESKEAARVKTNLQGIYIYRENRLIHHASWLRMWAKEPHVNLLRVELSFDHKLDDAFHIDVKKSQIILNEAELKWLKNQFLPAPRKEAINRYRKGQRKGVKDKAGGLHDGSNKAIKQIESDDTRVNVEVIDKNKGLCELSTENGRIAVTLPVVEPLNPGELFVQPAESLLDGVLFEPAIIEGHKAVRINTAHDYYHKVYMPNRSRGVTIQGMDSLLWGLCVAELTTIDDKTSEHFEDMRYEVSRLLRRLVKDLPDPKLDEETE